VCDSLERSRLAPLSAAGDLSLLPPALDVLTDMLIVTDAAVDRPGPRMLMVAGDVERLTGYSASELVGQTPRLFQGPRTKRATVARIRAALERGQTVREEILNYRPDGQEYWIELLVTPMRDAAGEITHFVSMQRDVSERRRMRRAILETAERVRDRSAYSLHELLAQEVAGIAMLLSSLGSNSSTGSTSREPALLEAQQRLTEVISLSRSLAHGLSPIRLGAGGLCDALRLLAESLSARHDVPIEVELPDRFSASVAADEINDVYRIAEEALTNAATHARARQIRLSLSGLSPHFSLDITDDGIGFDVSQALHGIGLDSMRYRARELCGTLELASSPGRGSRVRLRLGDSAA
jgi:PAS domain S-box-containing protein